MKLPPPFSWMYDLWMKFSHVLGMCVTKIILTLLWLTLFSLYGIGMKIFKLFARKPESDTYWKDVPEKIENDLLHQF